MAQAPEIDLANLTPISQDSIQPDSGEAPAAPNHKQLQDTIAKMKQQNGPIGEFNSLLGQREKYNENLKRLNQTQADDMLKQRADANRQMLAKMFLGGK